MGLARGVCTVLHRCVSGKGVITSVPMSEWVLKASRPSMPVQESRVWELCESQGVDLFDVGYFNRGVCVTVSFLCECKFTVA